MARSYGRLFAAIWDDEDFRPLSAGAKLMYGFLISQTDLEHSGIISLRPARWARDLGEPTEDVLAWLKELDEHRYVVTDEEAVELLVRSLIRNDDIWKQPNVFKAAAASARASKSPRIKATLYHEVRRLLGMPILNRESRNLATDLLSHLEPFANPSRTPPEGFPRGLGSLSEPLAKGSGNPNAGVDRTTSGTPSVDNSHDTGVDAGQNPSERVPEPLANPNAGVTGKGKGNGLVLEDPLPHSPTPSPRARPEPIRPLWPFPVPDAQTGEGDQSGDQDPDTTTLVAEVRKIRPAWSTRSIERALADASVAERPWPAVRAAMLAVAKDRESKHPGRLAHDGPWWNQAAATRRDSLPPVERHEYTPDGAGGCSACGLPESNRRHLEAS